MGLVSPPLVFSRGLSGHFQVGKGKLFAPYLIDIKARGVWSKDFNTFQFRNILLKLSNSCSISSPRFRVRTKFAIEVFNQTAQFHLCIIGEIVDIAG